MWHFYQHTAGKGETHQLFYSRCTVLYVCRVVSQCEVCFLWLKPIFVRVRSTEIKCCFFFGSDRSDTCSQTEQQHKRFMGGGEQGRREQRSYRFSPLKLPEYAFKTLL